MSNDAEEWGPRLYAYLADHWIAEGTNANAWTDNHPGIQGPTVSRWRTGTVPSVPAMRAVADALGVSMLDVLIAAGVVDQKEAGRDAARPAPPLVDAAIKHDPGLSAWQRQSLREFLAAMRAVEAGEGEQGSGPKRRRRK